MKFGRNLPRNMVPEWSANYIKYKALKKFIKVAIAAKKAGEEPDLAGFFYSLDRNLEDVDHFYNKKFADCSRRLKLLEDRFGHSVMTSQRLDGEDLEDLLAALLELRGQLRKLQWYGEVNRRGFIKITKKLDKKLPGAQAQMQYLPTKVDPSPFATNSRLTTCMKRVNDWLSVLGDEKALDDASSTHSSLSLKRVPSRQNLNLPASLLQATLKIAADDLGDNVYPKVLKSLLQRSIFNRSKACLVSILGKIDNLDEEEDINKRNCIHRLVISIGRSQTTADAEQSASMVLNFPVDNSNYITPAAPPSLVPMISVTKEANQTTILRRNDPSVSFLAYLLNNLRPHQRSALIAKDISGRTPLHYGAQYGFKVVCEVIIEHLQAWDMFDVSEGIDGPKWQDEEGWAPLHLSVVGGHPLTTRALLDAENWRGQNEEKAAIRKHVSKSSAVLALATKANFVDIVQLLVHAGVDINYQDEQGETALHVAARFGHDKCAKALLDGTDDQKANTELAENTYSWTPLFIGCVDGNINVVQLLIDAGADLERPDSSGWTAKEHAALRGHIAIAKLLAEATSAPDSASELDVSPPATLSSSPPLQSSLADRKSNTNGNGRPAEAIKSFGHRYLTDESMVLVSLGTMDMRKHIPAVNLDRIPMANAHLTQLDTALSIVVSASGAHGEPEVIDLPVQENLSTEPIVFHSADASKVKIIFDLVPTYAGTKDQILGRGVALLSSIKPSIGSKRISLQGDSTVPIIAANTLDVIGSVTFNFLIITPFNHPKMSWKKHRWPKIFTARGEYAPDHVPVIYHDFLVSETGIDAPVHTLTLEQVSSRVPNIYSSKSKQFQFLHISDGRTPRPIQLTKNARIANPSVNNLREMPFRQRSMSVGEELGVPNLDERMKHTRDFKKKGFKGNTRGNHIQAPFVTLEQLFKELPKSVGFNMELKYPMLHESEEEEMDTYAVELNSFVDTVLTTVYDLGEGRNMIFSSFNPDICLLISFKQPSIPVLFLTDSGVGAVGDIRASSLQEAIRFASRWNLLGVVTTAEPLVISPRLVRVVKESGLVCVSYGMANNDPANVKLQVNEGIDAVIVDSVLAIRKGLTEAENPTV
ncbi:conserved hypothetical protein [Uncinocarpus reesii 1704]|uniref:Glycerophosphodiester phosphodiesterase GDE1 n=1 Tax=Uncinocarpus reesii (strain UAMH 1704) TaxID=336963 RepID=C4JRX2_UNCRE|nr:uncharacterized protein UREG_05211 [Uncinocarpus reesii 1704]EEP80369.1 conserved hypothetical protein [Uncinocarpus reesii 1704]